MFTLLPKGKIWPAFIDYACASVATVETSRINYRQSEIALALVESLIEDMSINIVVVCPYRATMRYLDGLILRHRQLGLTHLEKSFQ